MHPDDVTDLVEEQVDLLREQLHHAADSPVEDVSLTGTTLDVRFTKVSRGMLVARPGEGSLVPQRVVDLSRKVTRSLILHMECDNFDAQPPTAELLDVDGNPLPATQWPQDLAGGGIVGAHPQYPRPFFCRRGLREYHTHPQHEDDPWDGHREGLALHALVLELLHDLGERWIGTN